MVKRYVKRRMLSLSTLILCDVGVVVVFFRRNVSMGFLLCMRMHTAYHLLILIGPKILEPFKSIIFQ